MNSVRCKQSILFDHTVGYNLTGWLSFFFWTHSCLFIIPRHFNFSPDSVAMCTVQTLSHGGWRPTVYNWKIFLKGIKDDGVWCPNLCRSFELNSGLHGPVFSLFDAYASQHKCFLRLDLSGFYFEWKAWVLQNSVCAADTEYPLFFP